MRNELIETIVKELKNYKQEVDIYETAGELHPSTLGVRENIEANAAEGIIDLIMGDIESIMTRLKRTSGN